MPKVSKAARSLFSRTILSQARRVRKDNVFCLTTGPYARWIARLGSLGGEHARTFCFLNAAEMRFNKQVAQEDGRIPERVQEG